jgi:copper ion binding protein
MDAKVFSSWRENTAFSGSGPEHKELIGTDAYRAVFVGLEAGQVIPPHPSSDAAYHILEGSGWMEVGDKRYPIEAGATVVVPAGIPRGVEAETRLAFFGSHGGAISKKASRKPIMMFALMGIFGLVVMVGLMLLGASPMAMMISSMGGLGSSIWSTMALPIAGLLGMFVMMFFMFRWMMGNSRMMAGNKNHREMMAAMKANNPVSESSEKEDKLSEVVYSIPSINCDHCKMRIEQGVGEIEGVDFVGVDVEKKQALIRYDSPATKLEVETVLTEIGYTPEKD